MLDTHLEIRPEQVAAVPAPSVLVERLEVCHAEVAGSGDDRAAVVMHRRVCRAVAVESGLGLRSGRGTGCAVDMLADGQS